MVYETKIHYICEDFFQIQVPTLVRDIKTTRKTSGDWISLFIEDLSAYEVKCEELVNEHVRATERRTTYRYSIDGSRFRIQM